MSQDVNAMTMVKLVSALATAGLVAGLIIVGTYLFTLPMIERNQAETLRRAAFKVLPGIEKIEPRMIEGGELVAKPEGTKGGPGTIIYSGVDASGRAVGFAVPAEGAGFADTIKVLYGFDPKKRAIVGMEVLDSRETPGLGDKIAFDPQFRANFTQLAVEPGIVPVKRGNKTKPNEVDCITGATISSKAVSSILDASTKHWLPAMTSTTSRGK
ncbi:MAG: FMN-binding protein [Deltaproteobacteria bacterium]|nr:FMN-binding protein [Deltaproteobacteria bacterium]